MKIKDQLAAIKPGKNYPSEVRITEDGQTIRFLFNSFFVGMYVAIYIGDSCMVQTGDYDNRSQVRRLKTDIANALKRGARVSISNLREVKTA